MLEDARRRLGKTVTSTASSHWHWLSPPPRRADCAPGRGALMAAPRKTSQFQIHVQAALPNTSHSPAGRPRKEAQERARMDALRNSPQSRQSRGAMGSRNRLRAPTRHDQAAPPPPRPPPNWHWCSFRLLEPSPSAPPLPSFPPLRANGAERQGIDAVSERREETASAQWWRQLAAGAIVTIWAPTIAKIWRLCPVVRRSPGTRVQRPGSKVEGPARDPPPADFSELASGSSTRSL